MPQTSSPKFSVQLIIKWHVEGENVRSVKFTIYNQWSELLFSTSNIQNGWDDTCKGTKEPAGVYV